SFLQDLDDEDIRFAAEDGDGPGEEPEERGAPDPAQVTKELQRVRDFIQRAETLPRDSKADKLLEVMRITGERPAERRRVVIFTESLVTQDYLQKVLIAKGGCPPESITLFRGTNDSAGANQ